MSALGEGSSSALFIKVFAMLPSSLRGFARDESGATSIEYALIASIVSLAIIGGLTGVRASLIGIFDSVVAGFGQTN
ncbi:Flp/Fap pilin component [Hyphomicrobium denitrificans 1NES1]|uniref:Flp/Fap pilin component n=2 Tax=Hyphomicrobium denitrificans TaxID=53399 RepID=N0B7L7_9HYPH|nr:Flp/Fap pilin component [Hyphomicrobium denitrificans 1NES1]